MDWHNYFSYDDGRLYWAVSTSNRVKVGQRAGTTNHNGYRQIMMKGKRYMEHRVIYEMRRGPIPDGLEIDHINGVKDDNRIENLRVVTHAENQHNRKPTKGFYLKKRMGKFQSQIAVGGKNIYLGHYDTEEEAREAYLEAKAKYHPTSPIVEAAPRS